MASRRLTREFFNRPTLKVAKELLGKFLVRKIGKEILTAMITETEAYCGPKDLASHASHGKTQRTEIMFGPPGFAYVYMIYGMYHCFNIVTEKDGYPAAVLIRGAVLVSSKSLQDIKLNGPARLNFLTGTKGASAGGLSKNLGGPGKLCRYMHIDKSLNKKDLISNEELWLEDRGVKVKSNQIKNLSRVGIDYAGVYKDKPWRFVYQI